MVASSESSDRRAVSEHVDVWALTDTVTRLRRVLRASIRQQYPWEQLPMAQVELMQRLADEPGLRLRELARRHRLATNTVSTLVQQLVTAGLVSREPDPRDRRAVVLRLTEDGGLRLEQWLAAHEERLRVALGQLSDRDRARIQAAVPALRGLVGVLEAQQVEAQQGEAQQGGAQQGEARQGEAVQLRESSGEVIGSVGPRRGLIADPQSPGR